MGTRHTTNIAEHAAQANKARQRFNPRDPEMEMLLRGLLHELRNPLSSILTASSLLQDSPQPETSNLDEESRMLLDVVKKESLRLNHILTEFAGYIKLPAPQLDHFDLAQAARAVIRELQLEGVLQPPIKVQDEMSSTCPIWADENQIRTALAHILRNAAEEMPAGGELWISNINSDDEQKVILCITDSGQGFTPESRDRAFQPFYSSKEHSIGLGLSSVLSLIEASNGRVWLEEAPQSRASATPERSTPAKTALSVCLQLPRFKP